MARDGWGCGGRRRRRGVMEVEAAERRDGGGGRRRMDGQMGMRSNGGWRGMDEGRHDEHGQMDEDAGWSK